MKKIKLLALSVLVCFAISCEKDQNAQPEPTTLQVVKVGELHNQGLMNILDQMKQMRLSNQQMTRSELIAFTKKTSWEFMNQKFSNLTSEEKKSLKDLSTSFDPFKFIPDGVKNGNNSAGRENDIVQDMLAAFDENLTSSQSSYLGEIFNALIDDYVDMTTLNSTLNRIEGRVNMNLNQALRGPILTAIDMARNSATFWNEHADEYEYEINYINNGGSYSVGPITRTKQVNWGKVAACDVAAATSSAAGCAVAALTGPIGWGFVASVVGGTTVASSGVAAIAMYLYCPTPCP